VKDNNDHVLILVGCPGAVPADFIFQLKQQSLIIKVTPSYTIVAFDIEKCFRHKHFEHGIYHLEMFNALNSTNGIN